LIFSAVLHPRAEANVDCADDFGEVAGQTRVGFGNEPVNLSVRRLLTRLALGIDV